MNFMFKVRGCLFKSTQAQNKREENKRKEGGWGYSQGRKEGYVMVMFLPRWVFRCPVDGPLTKEYYNCFL